MVSLASSSHSPSIGEAPYPTDVPGMKASHWIPKHMVAIPLRPKGNATNSTIALAPRTVCIAVILGVLLR